MRWLVTSGTADAYRRAGSQRVLIDNVRHDVREALRPPAARPWRSCACHPWRRRTNTGKPEPKVPRGQGLAYLATFKPKGAA
jgi:hypothetical protein